MARMAKMNSFKVIFISVCEGNFDQIKLITFINVRLYLSLGLHGLLRPCVAIYLKFTSVLISYFKKGEATKHQHITHAKLSISLCFKGNSSIILKPTAP